MIGAIIGDIIGSVYERRNVKAKQFELFKKGSSFTDDSVMTIAVADALLKWNRNGDINAFKEQLIQSMHVFGNSHPFCGFGGRFRQWIYNKETEPYNSWGNGSAMRVSPCAFFARDTYEAQILARASAEVTHNHPEGIKGAESVAVAIYMLKCGHVKEDVESFVHQNYYPMDFSLDEIRVDYRFDVSCQGSVPQAFKAFFESVDFEDAIRNAISIGGDSDTIAAICGGLAEAYYGVPKDFEDKAISYLDDDLFEVVLNYKMHVKENI